MRIGTTRHALWHPCRDAWIYVGWMFRGCRFAQSPANGFHPSVVLPAPDRLVLKATLFPGVMTARWRRVTNFRFQEIQRVVLDQASAAPDWENVPFRSNTLSSDTFPKADIGQRMVVRVRIVGSKGASPWSQEVVAMVL